MLVSGRRPQRGAEASELRSVSCSTLKGAVDLLVDVADFLGPSVTLFVGQLEDVLGVPVKVVGDVGYLLVEPVQGVANYSPRLPNSFSKLWPQFGHLMPTETSSSLMRL